MSYVTNRVNRVFVVKNVEHDATSVATLEAGEVIIIKRNGLPAASGTLDTLEGENEYIQVVLGAAGNERLISPWIDLKSVRTYTAENFRAEVQQVTTVAVGAIIVGAEYILTLIETSEWEILNCRQAKYMYSYVAQTGDTADTVAAAIRAKINADPNAIVVASGATNNIILTAKATASLFYATGEPYKQITFSATFREDKSYLPSATRSYIQVKNGTVTLTTPPDCGCGTFRLVREAEKISQGYVGVTNQMQFPVEQGLYQSLSTETYDMRILEWDQVHDTNSATYPKAVGPQSLIFACVVGAATAKGRIYLDAQFGEAGVGSAIEIAEL